jgi:hypothetical protein
MDPRSLPKVSLTPFHTFSNLDKLLESAVERGAEWLDVLVEVDGEFGALGDASGCELEFLSNC